MRIETTETNKIALVVMFTLLGTMALGVFSNALYSTPGLEKPGYPLPGGSAAPAAVADAPKQDALPILLAKADVSRGQADVKVCQSCHSFEKGGVAKVGPPLYGVLGRPKGSIAGFNYSDGMKAKGGEWTFEDINTFITKPSAYVSGTKMTYPGESDEHKRADIIDYIDSLSDNPIPLPKP